MTTSKSPQQHERSTADPMVGTEHTRDRALIADYSLASFAMLAELLVQVGVGSFPGKSLATRVYRVNLPQSGAGDLTPMA